MQVQTSKNIHVIYLYIFSLWDWSILVSYLALINLYVYFHLYACFHDIRHLRHTASVECLLANNVLLWLLSASAVI